MRLRQAIARVACLFFFGQRANEAKSEEQVAKSERLVRLERCSDLAVAEQVPTRYLGLGFSLQRHSMPIKNSRPFTFKYFLALTVSELEL